MAMNILMRILIFNFQVKDTHIEGITTEPNPTKQEDDGEGSGGDGGDGDKKNGADSPGGPSKYFFEILI